jgi:hypothetical protein
MNRSMTRLTLVLGVSSLLFGGCTAKTSASASSHAAVSEADGGTGSSVQDPGTVSAALSGDFISNGDVTTFDFDNISFGGSNTYEIDFDDCDDPNYSDNCANFYAQTGTFAVTTTTDGSQNQLKLTPDDASGEVDYFVALNDDGSINLSSAAGDPGIQFSIAGSDDSSSGLTDPSKSIARKIAGTTWENQNNVPGDPFASVELNTDNTYTITRLCGGNGSCKAIIPPETGTWGVSRTGPQLGAPAGREKITFTPDGGGNSYGYFIGVAKGAGSFTLSSSGIGATTYEFLPQD